MIASAEVIVVAALLMVLNLKPVQAMNMILFQDQPYQSNFKENWAKVSLTEEVASSQFQDFTLCLRFR